MTLEEAAACEEIRNVIGQYNVCGDAGDAHGFANVFTLDAVFESRGMFSLKGREAIREWKQGQTGFVSTSFRMHFATGTWINIISPEAAEATSHWMCMTDIGPDRAGRYVDRLVKTAEGWRISARKVESMWKASGSLLSDPKP